MWKTVLAALLLLPSTSAMAQSVTQKRTLYALMDAAPEYCPDIETRMFAKGALRYDMGAPGEYELFSAERKRWLDLLKNIGSREVACASVMDKYGAGNRLELFQYR